MEDGGKAVRYECTRCGACCRWAGDVCIETDEIREISRFLDMDEQVFIDTCCRLRANRRGIIWPECRKILFCFRHYSMDGVKSGWNLAFFTGTEPDPVQNRDRTY